MQRRRIYASELRASLGIGKTWWFELVKRGTIPRAHHDPQGSRGWYSLTEVEQIVRKLDAVERAPLLQLVRRV